jgi:YesN/AraC family two-component response regulator
MKRILVVDDNMMMRKLIINLLRNEIYEIDEASNGSEGLEKMADTCYDLIITDIIMPGMEGIEMIMQTKQKFPTIKIIAISGGKPYYLYLAKKLGVDSIFTKPLNHQGFLNQVNSLLTSTDNTKVAVA